MRKVTAIIAAVILAFVIALGDQIIKLSLADNPLGINTVRTFFGFDDGSITIPNKPKIPTITEKKEEEVNLSYDERIEKGDYYHKSGFFIFAANEYVKAANLEPERTEPYLKLIKTNLDLVDYGKARRNAEQVLILEPANYEAQYSLVLISLKQNEFTEALDRIDRLLVGGITDHNLFYLKGLLKIAFNEHEEGKELLQQAKVKPSADYSLLEEDNELNEKIDKILAGYEEFEFAKAAEELYLSELLARSFNQIGEYELAIYKLKEILKARSDLRDSWIMLGFAYLNLEKYLFAVTSFEHAYELDSEWPATQYFLGVTYAELSKYDDAIIYLNYALNNGFEPVIVVKQKLADLYLEVGNYEESVEAYREVIETNKDVDSFVRPIWIYLDFLEQPEKALKLGEKAVITFPESPMAYNLLGWSQVGTKNYVEAEKNLKKSITMDPTFAAAHYNLAKLYEDMNEEEQALKNYQSAYELDANGSIGNLAAKRYNAMLLE
ncbi:tetratricopeptide repeat protein [candidate division KSB1 bacterium]